MLPRWISKKIQDSLSQVPALAILGTRQIGKTTLSKTIASTMESIYLDLESPDDLLKLGNPTQFLKLHQDKLVILDEIQRSPDLFMVLRGLIDQNRQNGKKAAQYLILGSASMDLLRQSSESLAGRIRFIEMSGLNCLEIEPNFKSLQTLWYRGGYPDSYLSKNDAIAMDWVEDLIRSYLERDIPQMGFRIPAIRLRRLWTMLSHLQGETINASKLASNLEVDAKTIRFYIDILSDLLLLRSIQPWHSNTKKRLVKSPRYYIRDSGILHRLLGIDSHNELLSHPILGKSWEGFVIENIQSILPQRAETYFYRSAAGAEIDLVIKLSSKITLAIEIKHSTTPKIPSHFSETCNEIGATHKYIVYSGDDEFPSTQDTTIISLPNLLNKILSLTNTENTL